MPDSIRGVAPYTGRQCGQAAANSGPRRTGRMTYNFDPDRWLEDQQRLLEMRRARGELGEDAYLEALRDVERRYDALVARLDGTFQLSPPPKAPGA